MTKHDLRKECRERRQKLTALEVAKQSEAIAQRFFGFFDVGQMTAIHSYLPIESQHEVNTFFILNVIQEQFPQTQIIVPRVIPNTADLEHYSWKPDTQLTQNQWNIPEPSTVISNQLLMVNNSNVHLVIIPLLAYDQIGHRVGYGKGFYDRFLSQCPPSTIKVGLSFFEPVALIEDPNPLDIRLDYCVSPTKIWVF